MSKCRGKLTGERRGWTLKFGERAIPRGTRTGRGSLPLINQPAPCSWTLKSCTKAKEMCFYLEYSISNCLELLEQIPRPSDINGCTFQDIYYYRARTVRMKHVEWRICTRGQEQMCTLSKRSPSAVIPPLVDTRQKPVLRLLFNLGVGLTVLRRKLRLAWLKLKGQTVNAYFLCAILI